MHYRQPLVLDLRPLISYPNAFHCIILRLYSVVGMHVPSYFHLLSCESHFLGLELSSMPPLPLDPLVDQSTYLNFSFLLVSMRHSATVVHSPLPLWLYHEVQDLVFPRRNVPNEVLVQ